MKSAIGASVGLALWLAAPAAHSDAATDARYIVDQTITAEMLGAVFEGFAPVLISAIENDLRKQGISISDSSRFYDVLVDELSVIFIDRFKTNASDLYIETFSPRELQGIAVFYASEPGQALVRRTPAMMIEAMTIGERIGLEIAQGPSAQLIADRLAREGVIAQPAPE